VIDLEKTKERIFMGNHQNSPCIKEEKVGKIAWCACGETKNDPYCDGSHKNSASGLKPIIVDISEDGVVAWCRCRQSKNKPYCDGSHAR